MTSHDLWGSVIPAWIGALGTAGAVIYAVVSTARSRSRAQAAEEAIQEEKQREQASRIAFWVEESSNLAAPFTLLAINGSGSAVYDANVRISYAGELVEQGTFAILPPTPCRRPLTGLPVGADPGKVGIRVQFRDGAGRRWVRDEDGSLTRAEATDG